MKETSSKFKKPFVSRKLEAIVFRSLRAKRARFNEETRLLANSVNLNSHMTISRRESYSCTHNKRKGMYTRQVYTSDHHSLFKAPIDKQNDLPTANG